MSYFSRQAGEIVADNNRQPTDLSRDDWTFAQRAHGSDHPAQAFQGTPWLHRQPPRLRSGDKA